jgi:AraC family transcriptional regulator of adaptative response/methylated-DNA-[protein]-cysteine methyltransferase
MIEGVSEMTSERPASAAEEIRYGFRATATGMAAIAFSTQGVIAVLLGTGEEELRAKLAGALPGAKLTMDEGSIDPMLDAVARHLDAPCGAPGFDMDLRGDDRELAVWAALRAIPSGETRSYGAIAKAIGTGLTAQEVGAACAANRIAVVIPCHRVVKADGAISGYRWGVHRKRKLLALEQAA